ncbi:MAG: hypothetical protein KIC52_06155 [Firmicutes bacterium]|nr:hypothetical protein [Bacillota bacterium]
MTSKNTLPITFTECRRYYPNTEREDQTLAYGITGGISLYMEKISADKTMEFNEK